MTEELKKGIAWRGLQTECPHCGEVFDIDEHQLDEEVDCHTCSGVFIASEDG